MVFRSHLKLLCASLLSQCLLAGDVVETRASRAVWFDFQINPANPKIEASARDWVALMQTKIEVPGVEFVERAELARNKSELLLSRIFGGSRADTLRAGHFLKADFALRGNLFTNSPGAWELELELIDLAHAEILRSTNFSQTVQSGILSGPSSPPADCSQMISAWLKAAHQDRTKTGSVVKIAILPQTASPAELESRLTRLAGGNPVRFIKLSRGGAAVDEADLALSGLTEFDSDAWLKVADYYVWTDPADADGGLHVWDGRTSPRFQKRLTDIASGSKDAWWERKPDAVPVEAVREQLSTQLTRAAWKLAVGNGGPDLHEPQDLADWFQSIWMLETAIFFNPSNGDAHEAWTRLRFDFTVAERSRSRLDFYRQRADAWRRYIAKFGYSSRLYHNAPGTQRGTALSLYFISLDSALSRGIDNERCTLTGKEYGLYHAAIARDIATLWLECPDGGEKDHFYGRLLDHMVPAQDEPRPTPYAKVRFAALRDVWRRFPPIQQWRYEFGGLKELAADAGEPEAVGEMMKAMRQAATNYYELSPSQTGQNSKSPRPAANTNLLRSRLPTPASAP